MLNQHQTIKDNIAKYNKFNPLIPELQTLLGERKEANILDVGSGAYSIIGDEAEGKDIKVYHCDNQDFTKFWKKYKADPFFFIEPQNMEALTYEDYFFDIVCCFNALDHTKDAKQAVKEMMRVCKLGGFVYIECNLYQRTTGPKHYWNANEYGVFTDEKRIFDLKKLGFKIQFIDNGGERRYNKIIATLQK